MEPREKSEDTEPDNPDGYLDDIKHMRGSVIVLMLSAVAVGVIVGSIIACFMVWPEGSYQSDPTTLEYALPLGILAAGSLQGLLLLAFSAIVSRLNQLVWLAMTPSERKNEFGVVATP